MTVEDHRKRHRPIPGGVSVSGPWSRATGTNGMTVIDLTDGELVALSNDHVYGFQPDVQTVGCMQPGSADREEFSDPTAVFGVRKRVAEDLSKPDPQGFAGIYQDHYVDAAIARPGKDRYEPELLSKEILELGIPKGAKGTALKMRVQKSGRTSGLTKGEITAEHATVFVGYQNPNNQFYRKKMVDQIITPKMLDRGDSGSVLLTGDAGSLLVSEDGYVLGLGFAGSDKTSIFNRWEHVERLMRVKVLEIEQPPIPPPVPPEEKLLEYSVDEGQTWLPAETIRVRPKEMD